MMLIRVIVLFFRARLYYQSHRAQICEQALTTKQPRGVTSKRQHQNPFRGFSGA
jgi:hypothetical protein